MVSESGRIALDASPTMCPDGKSATFINGAITVTALLIFAGKALTAADVPIFVHQVQA